MITPSDAIVMKALDGLNARSLAIAQNIANASTANYRPLRVDFEAALADAARRGPDALAAFTPAVREARDEPLRLDLESASASQTALRYSALVEALNRELQINAIAVSGSR